LFPYIACSNGDIYQSHGVTGKKVWIVGYSKFLSVFNDTTLPFKVSLNM
jgi:hypothetical protein